MGAKGYNVYIRGHGHFALTLGEKEETAEAHSSTSLRGLFVGGGSMWVLTKVRAPGDGGALVRPFLGGKPVPGWDPGAGYLVKLLLSSDDELIKSSEKFAEGVERDPGD